MESANDFLLGLSVIAIPLLLAITLHEAAHGYVANMLGDPTAKKMGRLSLNPIRHIDPFGTIMLPVLVWFLSGFSFIFGYAKPVPVTTSNLRNPKRDMIWVALAGPAANIFLALSGGVLLVVSTILPEFFQEWFVTSVGYLIFFNLLFAIFNMIPLPPLDGGRVLTGLLPGPLAYQFAKVERFGIFIFLGLIFVLPWLLGNMGINFNLFEVLVFRPALALYNIIVTLFTGGMA